MPKKICNISCVLSQQNKWDFGTKFIENTIEKKISCAIVHDGPIMPIRHCRLGIRLARGPSTLDPVTPGRSYHSIVYPENLSSRNYRRNRVASVILEGSSSNRINTGLVETRHRNVHTSVHHNKQPDSAN